MVIFRPACLAPIILIAATAGIAFIVFAPFLGCQRFGQHFNIIGFISATGISVTAWLHFLHRRKIWEDSPGKAIRQLAKFPEAPDAEFDAPTLCGWFRREIAYLTDYFNLMRALRDRKRDKIIESDTIAKHKVVEPFDAVHSITLRQDSAKAANFLREAYRKPPR